MIRFYTHPTWYRASGLLLFSAQLWLFVACLQPFQLGVWFQTEPSMVALFSLNALAALWLALGGARGWLAIERPLHPLLLALLAWAGVQILSLLWAENPLRSWFGAPQTGEGAGFHVMLLVSAQLAMPLWQHKRDKTLLLAVAVSSMAVMAWLHFNPARICNPAIGSTLQENPMAPANWPDYLGFIAGWLWIIFACTPSIRTPMRYAGLLTLIVITLQISDSHAAQFLMRAAIISSGIALGLLLLRGVTQQPAWRWLRSIPRRIATHKIWKILVFITIIAPLSWSLISQQQAWFPNKHCSLSERAIFNQIAASVLRHEPSRCWRGAGWNSFDDETFQYGIVEGLHSFKEGEYAPNSNITQFNVFHTHNQPIAALLSLGMAGFIVWMGLWFCAIMSLRRALFWWCAPMLVALSALSHFWFILPQVLPFQALGMAALCTSRPLRVRPLALLPRYVCLPLLLAAGLFAASAWQQWRSIEYTERFHLILHEDPQQPGIQEWMAQDLPLGGDRLTAVLLHHAGSIGSKISAGTATEKDRDWYRQFLDIASRAGQMPHAGARLVKLEPELAMMLFRLPPGSPLDALKPAIKDTLPDAIIRISAKAPEREDFIAPFMMSLDAFTHGNSLQQHEYLLRILNVAPNHRSALWLMGSLYETLPETHAQGVAMKKRAAALGVERVFPVTSEELQPYLTRY